MANMAQKKAIAAKITAYQQDPIGFMTNVLSLKREYVWDKMIEVCEAVRDHKKVAVRAGHSVSKTYTMGRVVPWFKTCWQPSTVVTTAPSDAQVRGQLWREIHAAIAGSKVDLGGKLTTLQWDVKPSKEVLERLAPDIRESWEKNFAIGFSTSPDSSAENATKMQGWHNDWVLIVIDEAAGIHPTIWRTAEESLLTDDQCKIVAIGNPTNPDCEFAQACYSSDSELNEGNAPYISDRGWCVVTIAATDTPNYKARKRVVPGLASYDWVQDIIRKYGPDGDGTRYRVKGLFPKSKEGTYYGRLLARARAEHRIGEVPYTPGARVHTFNDTGDMYFGTLFVQFIGQQIRVIDEYWDYEGMGLPAWAKFLQSKPYIYGDHFVGPDLDPDQGGNARSMHTGKTAIQVASQLGYELTCVCRHSFNDGIEAGRGIWPFVWIDSTHCDYTIKALAGYGKKKNASLSTGEETVYHDQPAKTWHRHLADAWRHLAMAYRFMEIDEFILGYEGSIPVWEGDNYADAGVQECDLLSL